MKILDKIEIEDNDVYILAQSKNYLVINSNHSGLDIYDFEFRFIKTVKISEELLIYNLYSSKNDDQVVVFDGENKKLFLVDLNNSSVIIQMDREEVFLNWFDSGDGWFALRNGKNEFRFSSKTGEELSCKPYCWVNNLSYKDGDFLFEKDERLYISRDNTKRRVSQKYDQTKHYNFSQNYIVVYDEDNFIVKGNHIDMKFTISDKSNWTIREILVGEESLILLLNDKTQATKSAVIRCRI